MYIYIYINMDSAVQRSIAPSYLLLPLPLLLRLWRPHLHWVLPQIVTGLASPHALDWSQAVHKMQHDAHNRSGAAVSAPAMHVQNLALRYSPHKIHTKL